MNGTVIELSKAALIEELEAFWKKADVNCGITKMVFFTTGHNDYLRVYYREEYHEVDITGDSNRAIVFDFLRYLQSKNKYQYIRKEKEKC